MASRDRYLNANYTFVLFESKTLHHLIFFVEYQECCYHGDAGDEVISDHNIDYYRDVIMDAVAPQITSVTIIYSTVYSGADQSKHQRYASLAFLRQFTGDRWIPRTKTLKCFHLMTSSCHVGIHVLVFDEEGFQLPALTQIWEMIANGNMSESFLKILTRQVLTYSMMTSSYGNIFRATGQLCGEFTIRRWISRKRPVTRSLDVFFDLND